MSPKSNLLPTGNTTVQEFQQYNASIHTFHLTEVSFKQDQVTVLDIQAISHDLNRTEKLSRILERAVYATGRQFSTIQEIQQKVQQCRFSLNPQILLKLFRSMTDRIINIIERNGCKISI